MPPLIGQGPEQKFFQLTKAGPSLERRDVENIQFDVKNCKIVDISEVRENTWNPKKVKGKGYQEVYNSVKNRGLIYPIMVRTNPSTLGQYEILDGAHRYNACKDLGYQKVLVYDFGEMEDEKAKSYTIYFETGVRADKRMFESLLIELKDQIDLPYSVDFIDGLELNDFSEEEPVREKKKDFVPDYCFNDLTQDEFDWIAEEMDLICEALQIRKEKDALIEIIRYYKANALDK